MQNMQVGFLFPGQGSQYVGMGKDLYNNFKKAREIYEEANDILGFDLAKLSFEGPADELTKTLNTQPAILVHSVAAMKLLQLEGVMPVVAAGHSLGEFTAHVCAGSMRFADALSTVRLRGELMYESGVKQPGTMAAVIGLENAVVDDMCRQASAKGICQAANYNGGGQIVISGEVDAVQYGMELAKQAGAAKVVQLQVSGAFHSKLMEYASAGLTAKLESIEIQDAQIPVIANVSAQPVQKAADIRQTLIDQLSNAVRWEQSMKYIASMPVTTLVELGPGKVLKGLMRRIDRRVKVLNVEDGRSFEQTFHTLF
ncbi:MAG: [acyl-carrier-protein] S-malonyltransferase [Gemmatimonadetes bacterium]|nr:MAG: [acyl-carrier-protein] S-malonyltransferase [Gemmatimonadota bacterium]